MILTRLLFLWYGVIVAQKSEKSTVIFEIRKSMLIKIQEGVEIIKISFPDSAVSLCRPGDNRGV
jgi:hypothetical protein